jgi:hypothetical protein
MHNYEKVFNPSLRNEFDYDKKRVSPTSAAQVHIISMTNKIFYFYFTNLPIFFLFSYQMTHQLWFEDAALKKTKNGDGPIDYAFSPCAI